MSIVDATRPGADVTAPLWASSVVLQRSGVACCRVTNTYLHLHTWCPGRTYIWGNTGGDSAWAFPDFHILLEEQRLVQRGEGEHDLTGRKGEIQ